MANKSARSKGYRNYKKDDTAKKARETNIILITLAVIIVAFIAIVTVPKIVEASKYLKVKDGVLQNAGDNWLVRNVGSSSNLKYVKVAEINPIEGYELDRIDPGLIHDQERYFYYVPTADNESAPAMSYYASVGNDKYDALAETSLKSLSGFAAEVLYASEITTTVINDKNVCYYVLEYSYDKSEEQDGSILEYTQVVNFYIESNIEDQCVMLVASNTGIDDTVFGDRDAMIALLSDAMTGLTIAK